MKAHPRHTQRAVHNQKTNQSQQAAETTQHYCNIITRWQSTVFEKRSRRVCAHDDARHRFKNFKMAQLGGLRISFPHLKDRSSTGIAFGGALRNSLFTLFNTTVLQFRFWVCFFFVSRFFQNSKLHVSPKESICQHPAPVILDSGGPFSMRRAFIRFENVCLIY